MFFLYSWLFFLFNFLNCSIVHITENLPSQPYLHVQFNGIKYIHNIIQPCPLSQELTSSCKTETLCHSHYNSAFSPPLSLQPFYFLCLQFWLLQIAHISGIMQYLSFCDWLISLSIMSSGLIHTVARCTISFSTFCLSIHPLTHRWVASTY